MPRRGCAGQRRDDRFVFVSGCELLHEQAAVSRASRDLCVPTAALAVLLAGAHLEELAVVHVVRLFPMVVHLDAELARGRVFSVAALEEVALIGARAGEIVA